MSYSSSFHSLNRSLQSGSAITTTASEPLPATRETNPRLSAAIAFLTRQTRIHKASPGYLHKEFIKLVCVRLLLTSCSLIEREREFLGRGRKTAKLRYTIIVRGLLQQALRIILLFESR